MNDDLLNTGVSARDAAAVREDIDNFGFSVRSSRDAIHNKRMDARFVVDGPGALLEIIARRLNNVVTKEISIIQEELRDYIVDKLS